MDPTITELRKYLEKHKVSNLEDAKRDVVPVVKDIAKRAERQDQKFRIGEIEFTGSIYQKAKINAPDEFDFDLPLSELEINDITETLDGISEEYRRYELKPNSHWTQLANGNVLAAERVIQTFADIVSRVLPDVERRGYRLKCNTSHPAVTVTFEKNGKTVYDVDLVPIIRIKNWPRDLTRGWQTRRTTGWPSEETKQRVMRLQTSLVPKLPKGVSIPSRDIAWRYSFNNAEKFLLLDSKPFVPNSCRRPVLRILKSLRVDCNWPGIRSYHLKTIMLHEFESHHPREWTNENILICLKKALERLRVFLQNKKCPHYFLPSINLFEHLSRSDCGTIIQDINNFMLNTLETLRNLNGKRSPGKRSPVTFLDADFQIFVTDLNGKTFTVRVNSGLPVDMLKDQISKLKGIDASQFRLVFNGKNLEKGTMQSNGIISGSKIHMMARLRGGTTY